MKKIYLMASALMVGGLAFGQYATNAGGQFKLMEYAPDSKVQNAPDVQFGANIDRGSAFWTEDFSNGLAGMGTNGTWTQAGVNQIWKHDFFGTSGEWSTGTPTPATTTAANGFMLFDADSVNFVTSPTYNDMAGQLISPVINLSTEASVSVTFEQEMRFCCNGAALELMLGVSNDGGATWTEYAVDGGTAVNANTPSPMSVTVNITAVAANQSNVKIAFRFGGVSHYYWAVDDIMLTPAAAHEVAITTSGWAAEYDGVPYTMVPDEQDQAFYNFADMANQGASTEAVTFAPTVTGAATLSPGNGVMSPQTLTPGMGGNGIAGQGFDSTATWMSGTVTGSYDIVNMFTYADIAMDADPSNNVDSFPFWVTDYTYGRDIDEYTGSGLWNGDDGGTPAISNGYTMGPWYSMKTTQTIYSVKTALTASTDPGALIYAQIYLVDAGSFTLVYDGSGGNDEHVITAADISASPTITELRIPINEGLGFTMDAGSDYIVCIGHYGGPEAIVLMNGQVETPEQTVFLFDPNDVTWYYMTSVPVVRAVFDKEDIGVNENEGGITLGQNIPNPFNGTSVINYSLENASNVTLQVTDVTGKLVQTINAGNVSAGEHTITIDANQFAEGIYNYTLRTDNFSATKRMMITK